MKPIKQVHVVINPAAGREEPILALLNNNFRALGIRWDVSITREPGDGRRQAAAAASDGVDAVGVYGGDGTVAEVASGLANSGVPLAIFPGGTANVMAAELGLPADLPESLRLLGQPASIRTVDMGATAARWFLLRLGIGWEARWMMNAQPAEKSQFGRLAYVLSALRTMSAEGSRARYRVTVDDDPLIELDGVTCAVANSGSLGRARLRLAEQISVSDGLLDVAVLREPDFEQRLSPEQTDPLLTMRQGRVITIEADPPQPIIADGEPIGETPITAQVKAGVLQVIVPPGLA